MKYLFRAFLAALPLLAVTAPAHANGMVPFGGVLNWALCSWCKCCNSCGGGCCYDQCGCPPGPWYTYWPYEAHFATPSHPEFPYWPGPMSQVVAPDQQYHAPTPTYLPVSQPGYHTASRPNYAQPNYGQANYGQANYGQPTRQNNYMPAMQQQPARQNNYMPAMQQQPAGYYQPVGYAPSYWYGR